MLSKFALLSLFTILSRVTSTSDQVSDSHNSTFSQDTHEDVRLTFLEEHDSDPYVHISPIATKKGLHLATTVPFLKKVDPSLAEEIQNNAHLPAQRGDIKATWSSMFPNLKYFGGSLFVKPVTTVNIVWYGKWTTSQKTPILTFIRSLSLKNPSGKSVPSVRDWWRINVENYYDKNKNKVSGTLALGKQINDNYGSKPKGTLSKPLTPGDMANIIRRAFTKGMKPATQAAYLILTSKDVYVDRFCYYTCSYHTYFNYKSYKIAFAFIGDATSQCINYCTYRYMDPSGQTYNTIGIDGVISMMAHELAGMFTNPYQGPNSAAGWVVAGSKVENADLCSWIFGNIQWQSKAPHRAHNLVGIGGSKFIIQQNFNRKTGTCELKYRSK